MNCIYHTILLIVTALSFILPSLCLAASPEKPQEITLQLKWTHQFNFAGYYAAKEKGYYKKAGLDVVIKEGQPGTNFIEEVVSGRAQYGIEMPELLLERHKGKPIVVLAAIFQHSPQIFLALKESGISNPQGIVDKKIMARKDSSAELMAMLVKEGVPIEQLDITELSWDLNDLIEKKIDVIHAYLTSQPYNLREKNIPYTVLRPLTYGVDFYGDCLFTTSLEVKNHPERVRAFRAASLRGWTYAMQHPEEIIDLIKSKYKTKDTVESLWNEYKLLNTELMLPKFIEIGHMNSGRWQHIADTFVSLGMLEPDYSLKGFLYDPNPKPDYALSEKFVNTVGIVFLIVILAGCILINFNWRLNKKVLERTNALQESENRYRALIERIPYGIQETDTEGVIIFSNPAHHKIHGVKSGELIGKSILDFSISEAARKELADYLKYLVKEQPEPATFHDKNTTKDGRIINVSVDWNYKRNKAGEVIGFISAVTDITERKKLEESLQTSEKKYRNLFENANDAIFIVDKDLNYLDANKKAEELFGFTKEEFLQMNVTDVIPPSQSRRSDQEFRTLHKEGAYEKFIGKMKTKDGRWLDIEVNSSAIIENDQVVGSRDIVRDISHRLQLETQLRQAQKMEAIGTLAGGIAHDFNNILTAVLGYAELVKMDLPKNNATVANLDEVIKAAIRAKELVNHILTFSRKADHERGPTQVHIILKEALKLLRASIPTSIEIKQRFESKCGTILGDPTQIHQILMNLCTNAAHAMEEQVGTIEIILENVHFENDYITPDTPLPAGDYVKLTVSDTGPGIDNELKDRIFEPYFTTKEVGKGSGLGLAVVHGIVKSHSGAIELESKKGSGTTFHIYFPIIDSQTCQESKNDTPVLHGNERILLVDDEEAVINFGKKMMEHLGYKVSATTSSADALEIFRNHPSDFDLVITDQTMPKITGSELAKDLLEVRPDIPIILCTGYSSVIDEEKAKKIGIRSFIMKPFETKDLAEAVRNVLDAADNGG